MLLTPIVFEPPGFYFCLCLLDSEEMDKFQNFHSGEARGTILDTHYPWALSYMRLG